MTYNKDNRSADVVQARTHGFSPQHYREAMGPGYQVATFSEQPMLMQPGLTVEPRSVRRGPTPRRLWSLVRAILRRKAGQQRSTGRLVRPKSQLLLTLLTAGAAGRSSTTAPCQ